MNPKIGLTDVSIKGVVSILNTLLSDEYLLYTKTLNYHWNVEGLHFNELHKFFEFQYGDLAGVIDSVAERVRALGGEALGSLNAFLKHTRLKEPVKSRKNAKEMLKDLLVDHEAIIRYLRKDLETCDTPYQDIGTNDFLTGLMAKHEKMAWMLRASLG